MRIPTTTADGSHRTRRVIVTVALALLLMLAGCEQVPENQQPAGTAPATDGEATAAETHDGTETTMSAPSWTEIPEARPLEGRDLPPGVDESGAVNATRLLAAHDEHWPATTYRVRTAPIGSDVGKEETLVHTVGEAQARLRQSDGDVTSTYWLSAGELSFTDGSGVTYAIGRTPAAERMFFLSDRAETAALPYVRFGEFEILGAVEVRERRYVKLRLTGLNTTALAASPWEPVGPDGTVKGATGIVLVSTEGVVSLARIEVTYKRDGEVTTETLRYRLVEDIDPDLKWPAWASRAPQVGASLADGGTLLMLENVGGQPIEAGTELTFRGEDEVLGTIEIAERVGPDERLYVTVTWREEAAGTSVTVHHEPPEATNQTIDLRRYSRVVVEGHGENESFQAAT